MAPSSCVVSRAEAVVGTGDSINRNQPQHAWGEDSSLRSAVAVVNGAQNGLLGSHNRCSYQLSRWSKWLGHIGPPLPPLPEIPIPLWSRVDGDTDLSATLLLTVKFQITRGCKILKSLIEGAREREKSCQLYPESLHQCTIHVQLPR